MVDLSRVKIGDYLTFRGKVTLIDKDDKDFTFGVSLAKGTLWPANVAITNHEPREFQIGDTVTWGSGVDYYEIVAIKPNGIVVYHPMGEPRLMHPSNLTLVRPAHET
jgi:hypothetical protein